MRRALNVWIAGVSLAGLAACDEIVVVPGGEETVTCGTVTFAGDPGATNVVEGLALEVPPFSASSSAGAAVTYTLANAPTEASINSESGVFTYVPPFTTSDIGDNQVFQIKVIASAQPSGCEVTSAELVFPVTVLNDLDEDGDDDANDDDADGDGVSKADELSLGLDDLKADFDGDTHDDGDDNCPKDANTSQADQDGDDVGDQCDACPADDLNDADGDEVCDGADLCLGLSNPVEDCDNNSVTPDIQCDDDGDGLGETAEGPGACDPCIDDAVNDPDGDKACAQRDGSAYDNCPTMANPNDCSGANVIDTEGNITGAGQCDSDDDGFGDGFGDDGAGCDPCPNDQGNDADDDGACNNGDDNCPDIKNDDQSDVDDDELGDLCDPDIDGDDVLNDADNCPSVANPLVGGAQPDNDEDGDGDACDTDDDDDTVLDVDDNCQFVANGNQLDPDGDDVGFQCDSLEEVPFAVHEGTAIERVDGDVNGGTVALSFRGANPCTGAGCVQPGAYVATADDQEFAGHFAAGNPALAWLDLLPPGSDLLPPHVTQSGEALFPTDDNASVRLWSLDAETDTVSAPFNNGITAPPSFFDAPDGLTLIHTRTPAATQGAVFKLEVVGQPQALNPQAPEIVDSAGNGPMRFTDDTLYIPTRSSAGYTLIVYKADGTSSVPSVHLGPVAGLLEVRTTTDLRFVGVDPLDGTPWFCWITKDTPGNVGYFQMRGGAVVARTKTAFSGSTNTCSSVQARQSPGGRWFFVGPSGTAGTRRVDTFAADGDINQSNDPLNTTNVLLNVAASFDLHFTNDHAFIERANGTQPATVEADTTQFYWFNPASPSSPVVLGNALYDPVVDVEPTSNWFGAIGRTLPYQFPTGQLQALRYQGGVTVGSGQSINVPSTLGELANSNQVWIGPTGTMFLEYSVSGGFLTMIPRTLSPPSSALASVASSKVNVTFHGQSTLVSYMPPGANQTGQLSVPDESTTTPKLNKLLDIRGVHEAFQADALRPGMVDNFISYLDTTTTQGRYVVARIVTSPSVGLQTVLDSLISPPASVAMGPNNEVWFAYEKSTGYGYGSVSASAFTPFVADMEALEIAQADRPGTDDDALWGVVVRRTASAAYYACRLPVTVGAVTSAANCWQASEPNASFLWSQVADDRNVLYAASVSGSPAVVSLFQSVTEEPLLPSQIPPSE